MIPVSPQFLAAVRGSHQVVSRARLIEPGQVGTALPGRDLPIISGQVTLDSSADIRGTMDIDLAEPWPDDYSTNSVTPYGSEIQVSRGIVLGSGAVVRCPLGIYRVIDVEQDEAPFQSVHVVCRDRMSLVQESELLFPSYLSPTMTYGQTVERFIHGDSTLAGIFPSSVTVVWDDTSVATGSAKPLGRAAVVVEKDRFGFLDDLLKALGKIWYFDYQGILQIRTPYAIDPFTNLPIIPIPVPTSQVDAGKNGVLVKIDRSLTRTGACSAVVVTGEAFDGIRPPLGVAYDTNPLSPTWFYGPFGQIPKFLTFPTVETDAQAIAAASTLLLQNKGLPYSVNFGMVPNPALEPLDVVEVVYPIDLRVDPHVRRETHILEQVQIGLGADAGMSCKTRLSVTVL